MPVDCIEMRAISIGRVLAHQTECVIRHPNCRSGIIIREKINIYFSGATFQACLHENYILKLVLH